MDRPVILFDGVCNLCSWSVRFIVARDRRALFRFAALQSPVGERLQRERGGDPRAADSVVLIEGGRWYTSSAAAIRIARRLDGPWRLAGVLLAVPRPLRDWVYGVIARNRYRWFGKADVCLLPSPALRDRFLT